jgi:SM-20-related protein
VDNLAEKIIDAIAECGCYVGPSIFGTALTQSLALRAQTLSHDGALREARVGRATQATHHADIRSDRTSWLGDTPMDPVERAAVDGVNALRQRMNETLFLGARSSELHFAHYPPGAFYKTHRDRFADESARVISLVFYLNDAWPNDAGGELVIYDDAMTTLHRVSPRAGTMVAFRSEMFPHEVLPASRDRFSLTGWLRSRGSSHYS